MRTEVFDLEGAPSLVEDPRDLAAVQADICAGINRTRDARIAGGFTYGGARYQSGPSDRENIQGMMLVATAAQAAGAQPGDLRWFDPATDFGWITADNTVTPMDAWGPPALFARGVAFKAAQTFYARGLKNAVLAAPSVVAAYAVLDAATWPD